MTDYSSRLMDYYLTSALEQVSVGRTATDAGSGAASDDIRESFGPEFREVYDSLQAMRVLNSSVRDSHERMARENGKNNRSSSTTTHWMNGSSRLTGMLQTSLNREMDARVQDLLKKGMEALGREQHGEGPK
ncbi:MAG: hypothetical protein IJT34_09450 [Butyrivibrio sp.]|nr:hypothetical protein [Butyrivibrio sp.]